MIAPETRGLDRPWVPWAIVACAVAVRLYLVLSTVYLWDEDREWIVLARSISLDPGSLHLPLHGYTHPVLPAYFMKAGTLIFGETPIGFRLLSAIAGGLTVLVGYRLAFRAGGSAAGVATALLLALNEYHVAVSSVAVDMVFYLLFALLAMAAFGRFLEEQRPASLVLAGALAGLSYLCNERAALLVPVFGVALLWTANARWLLRWPSWAALAAFLAVISPDVAKNWTGDAALTQASHSDHLARISGIGVTPQPFIFYAKDLASALLGMLGIPFKDWAPEYAGMNALFGAVAALGVLAVLLSKDERKRPAVRLWLALLGIALAFLTLLKTSYNEARDLGPQAWYWADITLLPATLLAGVAVARAAGWRKRILVLGLVAGCLFASYRVLADRLGMPRFKAGASPAVLHPADDRDVEVRIGFMSCTLCDRDPEIRLEQVETQEGRTLRPAREEEARALAESGDRLVLRAATGKPIYVLHYRVRERSGRETRVVFDVLVRDEALRGREMFWLEPAIAASR